MLFLSQILKYSQFIESRTILFAHIQAFGYYCTQYKTKPMSVKVIVFLIFTALLSIFTYQNQILINVRFLQWEITDVPLAVILLTGLIFGFFLDLILQLPRIIKLKRELKKVVIELKRSEEIVAAKDEEVDSEGVSMGSDYKGGFFTE